MGALITHDPSVTKEYDLGVLVFQHLRRVGYMSDLLRQKRTVENIGKITCGDDRSFMRESKYSQKVSGAEILPYPIFGGAMRCSPYCPEMSDKVLGFKTSPNAIYVQLLVESIRSGIVVRGNRLLKAGGHGLHCGWATSLGLGIWQSTRLIQHGCLTLQGRCKRENWVTEGEYEIFPAYHATLSRRGRRVDRTYGLECQHPLVEQYSMLEILGMSDRRFLELEAPEMLAGINE